MAYELVIFDFDGTLADSLPWFLEAINRAADRYGFRRLEAGEIDEVRGYSARRFMKHLGVPRWRLPWIARYLRGLMAEEIERIRLFPGVEAMLRELAVRGVRLAIVSSNSESNVKRVLGSENAALIEAYACGSSIFGKRRKFRSVVKRAGVSAGAVLCVGDEIRDVQAARAAGLAFGAVAWGYTDAEALSAERPELMFRSVEEIVAAVL